jgi:hypothetical protein
MACESPGTILDNDARGESMSAFLGRVSWYGTYVHMIIITIMRGINREYSAVQDATNILNSSTTSSVETKLSISGCTCRSI